ncbi:MAG: type II toxin-antitoxin system Phd/YefM family antitoxin [Planctomycetota bacterium]
MKPIHLSEDIVPLGKLKTSASQVLRQLKETNRPIMITNKGKPAGVLITLEEYDRLGERDRFRTALVEGLADSEADRVVEDEILERKLASAGGSGGSG